MCLCYFGILTLSVCPLFAFNEDRILATSLTSWVTLLLSIYCTYIEPFYKLTHLLAIEIIPSQEMPRALGTEDGVRDGQSSQVKNESKRERVRQARQGKKPLKKSREAVLQDHINIHQLVIPEDISQLGC